MPTADLATKCLTHICWWSKLHIYYHQTSAAW